MIPDLDQQLDILIEENQYDPNFPNQLIDRLKYHGVLDKYIPSPQELRHLLANIKFRLTHYPQMKDEELRDAYDAVMRDFTHTKASFRDYY
jgi:hypothetical protein